MEQRLPPIGVATPGTQEYYKRVRNGSLFAMVAWLGMTITMFWLMITQETHGPTLIEDAWYVILFSFLLWRVSKSYDLFLLCQHELRVLRSQI